MKNLYFDTDSIMNYKQALNTLYGMEVSNRGNQRILHVAITCDGTPMGIWRGTSNELNNLMRTVSSTKLTFSVIRES